MWVAWFPMDCYSLLCCYLVLVFASLPHCLTATPSRPSDLPPGLARLSKLCLEYDRKLRPTFQSIMRVREAVGGGWEKKLMGDGGRYWGIGG